MKKTLRIKPLEHLLHLESAGMNSSPLGAAWPSQNVIVSSARIERRWDQELLRTFADGDVIQAIPTFRTNTGTQYNLVLTETDLAKLMYGTGETYQYLTDTYTTGTIASISGATVTGSSTAWSSSGLAAGDKFIVDGDHTAAGEPDTEWATISSVDGDTTITLTANYAGSDTSGTYKARKVHAVPSGERWQYAAVNGKFCYVNGSVYGQYWNGTDTYSTNINTTYCNQVRYCIAYANRLVTADMYDSGDSARNPWLVRWSKEGDPTDWTDSTAGFSEFIDSEEPIMGLGVSGSNLVVFKKNAFFLGYRTGEPSSPIAFPSSVKGIGLCAPYSLVHAGGQIAWMGLNDFYCLNGDTPEAIGGPIRKKFFDLVADDEAESVFGVNNSRFNEILWVANTDSGQVVVSYNWKEKSWGHPTFASNVTGAGSSGF